MEGNAQRPYYGYRLITYIGFGLIGTGIAGLGLAIAFTLLAYAAWVLGLCWALGGILFILGLFWQLSMGPICNAKAFAAFEHRFIDLLRTVWDGRGRVLDIGTGSGRVAVPVAREFPEAQVVGVDTWTGMWALWGQRRARAERNAMLANVGDRCTFEHGNALNLPFKEEEFSLVVSAFVFHEISVPDRTVLLSEAIRVLKPGGAFVIWDPFPRGYKVTGVPQLLRKVEQLGVEDVQIRDMKEVGLDPGGLSGIWGFACLSGRKLAKDKEDHDEVEG